MGLVLILIYCCPVKVLQKKIRLTSCRISAYFVTLLVAKNSSNMSKSTCFTRQTVYSQVIKLLDKAKIQQISLETLGSERSVSVWQVGNTSSLCSLVFSNTLIFYVNWRLAWKPRPWNSPTWVLITLSVAAHLQKPTSGVHKSSLPRFMALYWNATLHF